MNKDESRILLAFQLTTSSERKEPQMNADKHGLDLSWIFKMILI
jgi:hypothetical protein